MSPKVSIIVPNYNHQDFLNERLNSIFNQTIQDFEVIIFDDASTDNSLDILNKYKNHPKVSHFIVNKKNSGSPFKQWKEGMKLAKGEYIWIAETDDFAEVNFIEEQLKAIQGFDVAISRAIIVKDSIITTKEVYEHIFEKSNSIILTADQFFICPIKNVSCILFKKPPQNELDKMVFDTFSIIGDQFFYFEYFKGKAVLFNQNTISYFRRVSTSISNVNKSKGIDYLANYFNQHLKFSKLLRDELGDEFAKKYKIRCFNKVKNHTSRRQKISFKFIYTAIRYYLE